MANTRATQRVSDAKGTLWAYIQNWAARGISLLVFFVLVRVLSPAEFGTFAITMVFITVGEIFVEQLFGHAIVQRKELTEAHLSSAFWATLLLGIVLAVSSLVAAPYFAAAFDSARAAPLIMAITPIFIFMALNSVPAALLFRELDYRTLTRRTALSNLLSGIAAIAAAVAGLGVWTFVLQQLIFQAVSTVVLWHSATWRPHRIFNSQALGELFSFSSRVTAGKLLDLVETRVVELIIARYLGIVAVGNFSVAARAQTAATQLLAAPLWTSSVPIFARRQANRDALLQSLLDRSMLATLVVTPAFLFAAAIADAMVPTVFGQQWLGSVVAFQFLCLLIAVRSLTALYGAALQATGAAGTVAKTTLIRAITSICALPVLLPYGPAGAAAGLLLGQLASVPFIFFALHLKLGWSPMKLIAQILKLLLASLLAAITGLLVTRALDGTPPQIWSTLAGSISCVAVFSILTIFLAPGTLLQFAARLPTPFASKIKNELNLIIRFEDSIRVFIYGIMLRLGKQKRHQTECLKSVVLVMPDSYSIVGSVGDQALFGGLSGLLLESGLTNVKIVSRPCVALPKVDGLHFESLPIWGSFKHAHRLASEISQSRGLIIIGADTLDGFYSRLESLLRLEIASFAAKQEIPSILCSFSFNGTPDLATVNTFRKLHPGVTILCRDSVSRDRLAKVVGPRVELTSDLAYLLKPSESSDVEHTVKSWLTSGHRGSGPVIGWNMSPHSLMLLSNEQRAKASLSAAKTIERLIADRDATVVLVPHDFRAHASDPSMLGDIYAQVSETARDRVMLARGPYAAADVKQLCEHFDFVLTGRMHLMIAALGRDIPVLAMEYQGKFAGALAHFGLGKEQLMEPADVCSAEHLHQRVCQQLDNLVNTRAQIQKLRPSVQSMASATLLLKLR